MSGREAPIASVIAVGPLLGEMGTLDPGRASELAEQMKQASKNGHLVVLDFGSTGVISSAFANALFLDLNQIRPLESWRSIVSFRGLNQDQARVLRKSLGAAGRRVQEQAGNLS